MNKTVTANYCIYSTLIKKIMTYMELLCLYIFSGVTVLLSLTVFSIMVTEMLPKLSDAAPILG